MRLAVATDCLLFDIRYSFDIRLLVEVCNNQNPNEMESARLQKLERHNTAFNQQPGFQPYHSQAHHNKSGKTTTPRTSTLLEGKIMHRPHLCAPSDPWRVTRLERLIVRDVRGR